MTAEAGMTAEVGMTEPEWHSSRIDVPYPCRMRSRMRMLALLATAALVSGLLLACGEAGPPEGAEIAPDFTVQDAQGNAVTLSDLLDGDQGVILVFYRGFF